MEQPVITLKTIGRNIRKQRQSRQIKQESLAREIRMSVSEISRIENGQRDTTIKKLLDIADVLKMHPTEFFKE